MALFYRESPDGVVSDQSDAQSEVLDGASAQAEVADRRAAQAKGAVAAGEMARSGPWWLSLLHDRVRPLLVLGDVVACLIGGVVVPGSILLAVVLLIALLPVYASVGLYRSRLSLSVLHDLPRLAGGGAIALSLLLVYTYVGFGRADGFKVAAVAGVAILAVRSLCYAGVRTLRSSGIVVHPTVVVGADAVGSHIAEVLLANREYGLTPIGFVDSPKAGAEALPAPVLGPVEDLVQILNRYNPAVMILAHGSVDDSQLVALVRACHRSRCDVFVVPRLTELHSMSVDVDFVWDTPLVRLRRAAYRSPAWRVKRMLDVVFALVALVLLSPLMLACAAAVYLDGGRGVIFRQERVGCDGRRFSLLKFRSMRPVNEDESQTQWNISHDSRLGPVGRVLRKTSLDELPQLWNILRGDMSLVGPRPERPHFVQQFGGLYSGYAARHRVPSGLTGWAQVHGLRGDTSIDDRAKFDNFYIENWSLWLDCQILLRTVVSVVRFSLSAHHQSSRGGHHARKRTRS
jgi:exopolysaccharide biosynthesis polyprenyl glycosylphosphotransferase